MVQFLFLVVRGPCVLAVAALWQLNGARSPHSMHWIMYYEAT